MLSSESGSKPLSTVTVGTVARLAGPIVISMLSHTAMGLADTLFVGWLGTEPLAGVGLANNATWLTTAFGAGILAGVRISTAQKIGAERHAEAHRLIWQGLLLAMGLSLLPLLAVPFGGPLLSLLGASAQVEREALSYLQPRLLGMPMAYGLMVLSAWHDGMGDTRSSMMANVLANALNIALDPLFIFGLGMGTRGASIATVLAQAGGLLWLLWRARHRIRAARGPWDRVAIREVTRLGVPLGVQWVLEVGSFSTFAAILAGVGDEALAAHVIGIRLLSVSFLPGHAIGQAAAVLVGRARGAGQPVKAARVWRISVSMALAVMGSAALVFVVARGPLVAVFGPAPAVAHIARQLLLVGAAFQLADAVAMVGASSLNGAGDTRFTMVVAVSTAWLVKLPLGYLLAVTVGWGAPGAWIGLTAEIAVIAAIYTWRLESGRWSRGWLEAQAAAAPEAERRAA